MANPWQDLRLFANGQPMLPFPAAPPPATGPNFQDLAAFAVPPPQPPRGYGKGSVQQITPPRSYGPLGDLAQSHVDEYRFTGQMPPDPGFTELLPLMPIAPPAAPVDAAVRGVGNLVSRFPRAATATAGAGALTVAPGQANEPDALSTARDTIARLRASRTKLQEEQTQLMAEGRQFDKIDPTDKAAVANAQRLLGQKPDGNWGPLTSKAIAEHKRRTEQQVTRLDSQLGKLTDDIEKQEGRLTSLEGDERSRETRAGPLREAAREFGPWIAAAGGAYLGHRFRVGAARRANEAAVRSADEANALLTPGPAAPGRSAAARADSARRAGNLNEFWSRGGAGEAVPFTMTQTERGFRRRPGGAEPPANLFPAPRQLQGRDWGHIGTGLGEAGLSGGGWLLAQQELAAAQAAVDKDRSEANLARLERAHDMAAIAQAFMRGGIGYSAGRLGGAYTHPYAHARPNVGAAEGEAMILNQLLAPPKKKGRK